MEEIRTFETNTIIVVSGIPPNSTVTFIKNAFSLFGKIRRVFIPKEKNGATKDHCYIVFMKSAVAQMMIEQYANIEISNFKMSISQFSMPAFRAAEESDGIVFKDDPEITTEPKGDVFESPYHDFTSCYFQRPDRADPIDSKEPDFLSITRMIEMKRIIQFYNHGFSNDLNQKAIPEHLLAKFTPAE